jgi:hypothetical protein
MRRTTTLVPIALLALGLTAAHAEGIAITPNFSLPLGTGADLTYRLSPRFNVRVGGAIPVTPELEDVQFGDIRYDMDVKLGGVNAFLDWHPFAGNFHVSGGITTVRSPWTLVANSTSAYEINDVRYAADDIGRLTGEMRMENRIAPAVVFGWGNPVRPGKRWGAMIDLGLAYVGNTDFVLEASGPLASDPMFRRDLAREEDRHSCGNGVSIVVKVGLSYQF